MKKITLGAFSVFFVLICLAVMNVSATEKSLSYNDAKGFYYDRSSNFVYELNEENLTATVKGNPDAIDENVATFAYGTSDLVPATVSYGGKSYVVAEVAEDGFLDDIKIESVSFESNVKIGARAFMGCEMLSSVDLTGVSEIGESAFSYTALTSVTIPSTVERIENGAFYYSIKLAEFVGLDSTAITYIGTNVFSGTEWYFNARDEFVIVGDGILVKYNGTESTVVIPYGVKGIAGCFFANQNIESVDFSLAIGLKYIGSSSFYDCRNLKTIVLPESVEHIGDLAFSACTGLTSVTGGNGLKTIDFCAFSGCTALETVDIASKNLSYIGECAFWNCTSLKTATFASCPVSLGLGLFWNTGLSQFDIPSGTLTISKGAFSSIAAIKLEIPKSVANIDGEAFADAVVTIICYPGTAASEYTSMNFAENDGNTVYYIGDIDNDKQITPTDITYCLKSIAGNASVSGTVTTYTANTGRKPDLKNLSELMKYLASK